MKSKALMAFLALVVFLSTAVTFYQFYIKKDFEVMNSVEEAPAEAGL